MIIAFSGLDGAGKSTQIDLLIERLRREGRRPVYLWTRGGYTPGFERAKALLRRLRGGVLPPSGRNAQRERAFRNPWVRRAWLVLALLDLLWVYGLLLRWWRLWGCAVVCDRYLLDTRIDFRLNYPQEHVERWLLWRLLVWAAPQPDAALMLLVPVEESLRRSDAKGEPFRDPPEVLAQRLAAYRSLAAGDPWRVLDGRRPAGELAAETWALVAPARVGLPVEERSGAD